jgi:hypothetical protein
MLKELKDNEICLYIHEYMFIYDLYKSNNKNYEITYEDINELINDNCHKENLHKILLEVITIDNYKDENLNKIIKKTSIKISLDSAVYSKKLINTYKEFINKSMNYDIINKILNQSLIILIKSGKLFKHLIKFNDIELSSNELKRITETDYANETCLICLENINEFKSFRVFKCCFSNTCNECYKTNNSKCPVCNDTSRTMISY